MPYHAAAARSGRGSGWIGSRVALEECVMSAFASCLPAVRTSASAGVVDTPAPIVIDARVYQTQGAGPTFIPFAAKLDTSFGVIVRLTDGPAGDAILDGLGAPF